MMLALATLLLTGCAARRPVAAEVVLTRECMESVELTDKTECRGPSGEALHCKNLLLNKKVGCGPVLEVNKEKKQ